jgi:hypothetical protein
MTRQPLPLRLVQRCLARTRSGTPCQKHAAKGKKRRRLHGGAQGSGGPCGEWNGSYRHGLCTRETSARRFWPSSGLSGGCAQGVERARRNLEC